MKIVIDIDEDTYKDIKKGKVYSSMRDVPQESVLALANGTLLPKGHGDLIDRKHLCIWLHRADMYEIAEAVAEDMKIEELPTIIEAYKEVNTDDRS